ncbi:DUF2970 domain-containing protein [Halomonas sp. McH1-25]|uniref:DUF2970 domain-containing protein n=1 Tax=unclassified Halomonas TaxID=2609666 RepID=UPI001EF543A1|nr:MULTISPECIES: DUF2970 domain-containing protein [unclassified Halomonas]MCG7598566.1 DUF2970 domain-containing protein [Halomonas sp. McH1-25]MCP1341818.1 DUF2970 domain-containing protein [Halomonas sp. FL8]MCP1362968.1 DUF2970 domain-containing protein [Halomonas sp. BBD45]
MWGVVKSVLAAFFGVQKERQRQHDFSEGKPVAFIMTGIVLAVALVIAILLVATLASR